MKNKKLFVGLLLAIPSVLVVLICLSHAQEGVSDAPAAESVVTENAAAPAPVAESPAVTQNTEAVPSSSDSASSEASEQPSPANDSYDKNAPVELNGDSIEFKAPEAKFVASGNVVLKQNNAVLFLR